MAYLRYNDRMTHPASPATKLSVKLRTLQREVHLLRSFMISVAGKDREGAYRPELIRDMRKAAEEKPTLEFRDARSFLENLQRI